MLWDNLWEQGIIFMSCKIRTYLRDCLTKKFRKVNAPDHEMTRLSKLNMFCINFKHLKKNSYKFTFLVNKASLNCYIITRVLLHANVTFLLVLFCEWTIDVNLFLIMFTVPAFMCAPDSILYKIRNREDIKW